MIGKIILGKSFRGCISYVLENKLDLSTKSTSINRAELISFNLCFGDKKELIEQFNDVRFLNPKLSKPVMHVILSLSPGEKPDNATLLAMVEDCAKELGFEKNQFIAVAHNDTGHLHLHIVVNRIGFEGKTLSDSNNYKKIAAYCRKMELQYNLKQVLSPRAFLSKEMAATTRLDSRKEAMKTDIRISLLTSKTFSEFESLMKQKNYEVIKGRGVAFRDQKKMYAKGSELGYSLSKIEKILQLTLTQKQLIIGHDLRKENAFIKDPKIIRSGMTKSMVQENNHTLPKALEMLLRPEYDYEHTPHQLMQKKRKKKRSLHL
jgi:hypothetical protein